MKLTRDLMKIDVNGQGRYFVEYKIFDVRFTSSTSLNKITCMDLIDQLDGLELTERNVLIHDTNENDPHTRPVITYPARIEIRFNGEVALSHYLPYIQPTSGFLVPSYDLLSLQVLKNKLLRDV